MSAPTTPTSSTSPTTTGLPAATDHTGSVRRVLAISGSLRAASFNTALLRAAPAYAPAGVEIELYGGLRDLPPLDEDLEAGPLPTAVADLHHRVREADGLLIATPEYNYSVPGVLKNALDWASRPGTEPHPPLRDKPVAIMGASPSAFGTVRAQLALRQVLLCTKSRVVPAPEVMLSSAYRHFDEKGALIPASAEKLSERLTALLAALDSLIAASRPR
ncbi:NAD(P)H-dependent FMN reductase [Streptomyces sodiiphilus]|uniref:NAD(P)H-dependent FMN reductase n=1 Tax=Streptomyces sodiiphilus TaxID=226217 RepID=A0ABN2P2V9_9ACTN